MYFFKDNRNLIKESKFRFSELDVLRGLAVISMIIYHAIFMLDFYDVVKNEMYKGKLLIFVRYIQFSFLGLVGISMAIAYQKSELLKIKKESFLFKQWKKSFNILLCAMLITVVTKFTVQEKFVYFGILHLIAISIFFLSFFANQIILPFIIGIVSQYLPTILMNTSFSYILKQKVLFFGGRNISIDYFPIFPWIGIISFGIFIGNILYKKNQCILNFCMPKTIINPIVYLGRRSLIIYMIHVPILFIMLQSYLVLSL